MIADALECAIQTSLNTKEKALTKNIGAAGIRELQGQYLSTFVEESGGKKYKRRVTSKINNSPRRKSKHFFYNERK
jgi:hypothetical protein